MSASIVWLDEWVEGDRAGKVVECEVETDALAQEVLNFGIGLGLRQPLVDDGEDDLRDAQAEEAGQLAGDQLGDQRLHSLARAAELDDVRAVVVALDDRRQRAALAQRRHVFGGGDGAEHAWPEGDSLISRPRPRRPAQ
jgi:hypothetical protein